VRNSWVEGREVKCVNAIAGGEVSFDAPMTSRTVLVLYRVTSKTSQFSPDVTSKTLKLRQVSVWTFC